MRSTLASLILLTAGASLSCSLLVQPDTSQLYADGSVNVDGSVEGGMQCTSGCDDGIACTVDQCDTATGTCTHMADNSQCPAGQLCDLTAGCTMRACSTSNDCDDHNVCNGVESCMGGHCVAGMPMMCSSGNVCRPMVCDPTAGCQTASTGTACDDMNPCTTDNCDATANGGHGMCSHTPVDADGDGAPANMVDGHACAGGTDCNDHDPTIHPGATDTCDGVDRNCDGMYTPPASCPPMNDTCATATPINVAGGTVTVMGSTASATMDAMACRSSGANVWYQVTWPSGQDLQLVATPMSVGGDTVLLARNACTGPDMVCSDDYSFSHRASRIWIRGEVGATGTRTVWVSVLAFDAGSAGPFRLDASISAAIAPATCASTMFDLSQGGAVFARSPVRASMTFASCTARPSGTEDIYQYSGPTGTTRVSATSAGFTPTVYLRPTCTSLTELSCQMGNPATVNFNGGTATIFVDGMPATSTPYVVELITP